MLLRTPRFGDRDRCGASKIVSLGPPRSLLKYSLPSFSLALYLGHRFEARKTRKLKDEAFKSRRRRSRLL